MTVSNSPTGVVIIAALAALLASPNSPASEPAERSIENCLDCHDYGEGAPAQLVLQGSHGLVAEMPDRRACLDCHGVSEKHSADPSRHAPEVSFGPRWTATGSAQDAPCLACHQQDVAQNWPEALHMANNLTCITCHDIHTEQDRVLVATTQNAVCTTCHKAQKTGIHDLGQDGPENPPCSLCHNPHNHEAAAPAMEANQSAGCLFCHDAAQMDTLAALNPKAGNYHQAAARGKRPCLDCHQGISHAPEDSAPLLHPTPVRGREVTLFYPGNATRQWLTSTHPGSQPLRQGASCALCHRGDETAMGAALGAGVAQPSRSVGVNFAQNQGEVTVEISWPGTADDAYLALMWGDDDNTEFRRGGCFAACHDGNTSATGRIVYHGSEPASEATMGGILPGAELWRVELATGAVTATRVGAGTGATSAPAPHASATWRDGEWLVKLTGGTGQDSAAPRFSADQRYTFGIALHGHDNPGREHWVSLPLTFSLRGHSTDFVTQ